MKKLFVVIFTILLISTLLNTHTDKVDHPKDDNSF